MQIGTNLDYEPGYGFVPDRVDNRYWVMQDANYNVLGYLDDGGVLKERYEYTPALPAGC